MLKIRSEQGAALANARIVPAMAKLLRLYGGAAVGRRSDDELHQSIHDGLVVAERHGVTEPYDVYRFVEWQLRLGEGFDRSEPWVAEILGSDALDGHQKMNRIDYHARHVLQLSVEG